MTRPPVLYTLREAGERVGRGRMTLYLWRRDGLRYTVRAGLIVVEEEDLLAWYRERLRNDACRARQRAKRERLEA